MTAFEPSKHEDPKTATTKGKRRQTGNDVEAAKRPKSEISRQRPPNITILPMNYVEAREDTETATAGLSGDGCRRIVSIKRQSFDFGEPITLNSSSELSLPDSDLEQLLKDFE
jgi:hypothetical protein